MKFLRLNPHSCYRAFRKEERIEYVVCFVSYILGFFLLVVQFCHYCVYQRKNHSTAVNCARLFLGKCVDQLTEDINKVFNLVNCVFPLAVCSHIEHYLSLQVVALFTNYRVIRWQIHLR